MSTRALGILVLDESGELLRAASRPMRLRREPVLFARSVQEAIEWRRHHADVAVVVAPEGDAARACAAARGRRAPILVAVTDGRADVVGAFRTLVRPVTSEAIVAAVDAALAHASAMRDQRTTAILLRRRERQLRAARAAATESRARVRQLAAANLRLHDTTTSLARLLAAAGESGDPAWPARGEQVARVAVVLGRAVGAPPSEVEEIRIAALIAGIGRLSATSDDDVTGHAERAARRLENLSFPRTVIEAVRWHHERWDGRGNLSGLSGREIPRAARLISLAEAFVELMHGDGSGEPLGVDEAAEALRATAGRVHDPEAAEALARLVEEAGGLAWAGLPVRELAGATR